MSPDDERHGTYAGAMAHTRIGEPCCEPCSRARADYQKEWRSKNPHDRVTEAARKRAMHKLAKLHHEEYMRIYAAECRTALGLPRLDAEYVR